MKPTTRRWAIIGLVTVIIVTSAVLLPNYESLWWWFTTVEVHVSGEDFYPMGPTIREVYLLEPESRNHHSPGAVGKALWPWREDRAVGRFSRWSEPDYTPFLGPYSEYVGDRCTVQGRFRAHAGSVAYDGLWTLWGLDGSILGQVRFGVGVDVEVRKAPPWWDVEE